MSSAVTLPVLFLVLACVAFVTDIFETVEEGNMKKAFAYAGGVVALTVFCVYVIVTLNVAP